MALGTYITPHLLVGGIINIFAVAFESLYQGRPGHMQVHVLSLVAIGTANGVDDLMSTFFPGSFIESFGSDLTHHPGHIGAFTGPAGVGHRAAAAIYRCTGTQDVADVVNGPVVSLGLIVLF